VNEFNSWITLWEASEVKPSTDAEIRNWAANKENTPSNIKKDFIDTWKIPPRNEFPITNSFTDGNKSVTASLQKIGLSLGKRIGFRVYKDSQAAVNQLTLNLWLSIQNTRGW
jgi:hypothetical protein